MTYVDTWEHRTQFRNRLLEEVRRQAEENARTIDQGPDEGLEVVDLKLLRGTLAELEVEPLPPASGQAAEIATPGFVTLWAKCPRCGESAPIRVSLESELRVDSHAGTLHAKAKAKPASHVCGQTLLPVGEVEGQEDFELDDIVTTVEESIAPDLVACPYPGCLLPEEHEGDHRTGDEDLES